MQSLIMSIAIFIGLPTFGYIFAVPIVKTFFGSVSTDVFELALMYYRIVLLGYLL